ARAAAVGLEEALLLGRERALGGLGRGVGRGRRGRGGAGLGALAGARRLGGGLGRGGFGRRGGGLLLRRRRLGGGLVRRGRFGSGLDAGGHGLLHAIDRGLLETEPIPHAAAGEAEDEREGEVRGAGRFARQGLEDRFGRGLEADRRLGLGRGPEPGLRRGPLGRRLGRDEGGAP